MAFGAFERLLAFRYLRARRKEGFISVIAVFSLLGIFLGVGTLIVVMAVMNGFRQELLAHILGVNGHLGVYSISGEPIEGFADVKARIEGVPGVEAAMPMVQSQVMVTYNGRATGALLHAVRPEDLAERPRIAGNVVAGSFDAFGTERGILVGSRLAEQLGLRVGDVLTLLSAQMNITTIGSVPRSASYQVVGLFEVGMYEYDSTFIYMPMNDGQVFLQLKDKANVIEVFLNDPENVDRIRAQIRQAAGIEFRTVDWQEANASFFNAIQVERNVMFLILSLIILVAAFNITSGQYMLVKGKGRDIAILRTMGATRGMVLRIFFLSGASIGVVGTALGVIGGVLFADNIAAIQGWVEELAGTAVFDPTVYFLSRLPAKMDWAEVLQVVAMALALSFLAPLLPAWRAARLDPVEALRYE